MRLIDFNLFFNHSGDSLTVMLLITIPQYLGALIEFLTSSFKLIALLSILKSLTDGVISSNLIPF